MQTNFSLNSSEAHIGNVGGVTGYKELTLTLDTGAYVAGDVLADTQIIENIVRIQSGTGIIHSVTILDKSDQAQSLDLVFLRSNVSIGTENSPVSVSDTNADEILGVVEVDASDYVDLVNSHIATKTNLGIGFRALESKHLYVAAISRGTGTYAADGITLKITILQD